MSIYLKLLDAYQRCDGEFPPPDFVEGAAASELNGMIWDLIASLGYERTSS